MSRLQPTLQSYSMNKFVLIPVINYDLEKKLACASD